MVSLGRDTRTLQLWTKYAEELLSEQLYSTKPFQTRRPYTS